MGKWVHQPGDNQYGTQAQHERHDLPPQMNAAPAQSFGGGGGGGMSSWRPTPPPVKADISLDPIAADEPVPAVGFPPLPDRLDLPVQSGWAAGAGGGARGGAYMNYGGAAPPDGPGGGGGGPPQPTGTHQHYLHYEPGAFAPANQSHGYYKARTPPPPNSDYYNNNTAGGAPGQAAAGPTDAQRALRGLGREPKLGKDGSPEAPEAPQPVVVNQAATQDLSLPEDDFAYQKAPNTNTTGKRLKRQVTRAILRPVNSVTRYAGISF